MRKNLAQLVAASLASVFLLLNLNAMEVPDPAIALPTEIWAYVLTFCALSDVALFSEVSSACNVAANNDVLWEGFYLKRLSHTSCNKVRDDLSYKENLKIVSQPTLVYHLSALGLNLSELVNKRNNQYKIVIHEQRVDPPYLVPDRGQQIAGEIKQRLNERESLTILFSDFCFYEATSRPGLANSTTISMPDHWRGLLDLAKEKDVLVVSPVHNIGQTFFLADMGGKDVHEIYPNIIFVTAHKKCLNIEHYAGVGDLVDIAALGQVPGINFQGNTVAGFQVAELVSQMRSIRPDLTASEIRLLLLESAHKTAESQNKIPRGGILDAEAAFLRLYTPSPAHTGN